MEAVDLLNYMQLAQVQIISTREDESSDDEEVNNVIIQEDLTGQVEPLLDDAMQDDLEQDLAETTITLINKNINAPAPKLLPHQSPYSFIINKDTGEVIVRRRVVDKNNKVIYMDTIGVPKSHGKIKKKPQK